MAILYKVEDKDLNGIVPQVICNISPKNGHHFSLEELHEMIGGYIEIVHIGNGVIVVVDEEGILKERVYNHLASDVCGRFLVGNVLLCRAKQIR